MNEVVDFVMKYYFLAMQLTGVCLFLTLFLRQSKIIRTDWNKVGAFVGFVVFVEFMRMGFMDADSSFRVVKDYPGTGMKDMMLVFWEDMFFVMPIYFVKDYLKSHKYVWIPVAVVMSLVFGSLHVYQGYVAAAVLSIYPFFISYRYGIKNGFGTVMVCHIIFDFVTHLGYKMVGMMKMMDL